MGLMTGMAALYFKSGQVMTFDHKSALAVLVFVVLAILLLLHFQSGVRGKAATQLVLLAYLLLTLGYPGVKFVTDILLIRAITALSIFLLPHADICTINKQTLRKWISCR